MSLLTVKETTVTVDSEVYMIKEKALERSRLILSISNPQERDDANEVLIVLKTYGTWVDDIRQDFKKPYLDACKAIDAKAKELCLETELELLRLKKLASSYVEVQEAAQIEEIKEQGGVISSASLGSGISTSDEWDFEVVGPMLAFETHPELFDLVPKRVPIKKLLKEGVTIPGIRAWKEKSVRIKS